MRRLLALFLVLLTAPALAGCFSGPAPEPMVADSGWSVGDRWVYERTSAAGAVMYVREVTGLFDKRGHEVYEVSEGILGHPVQQYSLYTVGKLRFMGMDVREGPELRTRMDPEAPLTFHYVFPLRPGDEQTETGRIHQVAGSVSQVDTVEIEHRVFPRTQLALDERVYDVWPYEIRIRYTTTPFDDLAVIRGHWSEGVGQSVLTTVEEAGETRTYELLSFTRARPVAGPPAYRLEGVDSLHLENGLQADLDGPGYVRHLVHVERPRDVHLRFTLPAEHDRADHERVDFVALRPLGYERAGIAENVSSIAEPGVAMHIAAARRGSGPVVFHTPSTEDLHRVRLDPGQVYELIVASNVGPLRADLALDGTIQAHRPAESGEVDVEAVAHRRVTEAYGPGPQNLRDQVQAIVSVPTGSRIDGIVYAVNNGPGEAALGEVGAVRQVTYSVDGYRFDDAQALYGFYLGHRPTGTFTVEAGFQYRADVAVRGAVDYEIGALLVRLLPPAD